ncbi:MAG: hypothetical protein ACAH11_12200 [Sphingomonas sp.]
MADLLPPWLKHPDIRRGSIGWRMGYGETYLIEFDRWYASLGSGGRQHYREQYPEPTDWDGFYAQRRGR